MAELFANSEDSGQMPHSVASDLGLHCLPIILLGSPNYNGLRWFIIRQFEVGPQKCCIQFKNV